MVLGATQTILSFCEELTKTQNQWQSIRENAAFGIWRGMSPEGQTPFPPWAACSRVSPSAADWIYPSVLELFQDTLFTKVLSRQSSAPGSGDRPSVTASELLQPLTAPTC